MREMKKATMTAIVLSILLVSLVGVMQTVWVTEADPYPNFYSIITVENPRNTTYNVNALTVNFSVKSLTFIHDYSYYYSIDGNESKYVENMTRVQDEGIPINPGIYNQTLVGNFVLSNLSEGRHNLTIYQIWYDQINNPLNEAEAKANAQFVIDITPPVISDLYTNGTLHEGGTCLVAFKVNELTSWMGYSLDNQANVTITSNTTLSGLTVGTHNMTVYANDTAGNMGKADFVFYEGDILLSSTPSPTQQPTLEPSQSATPTTLPTVMDGSTPILGIIAAAIVAITIVGLAVYYVKSKNKNK